MAPVKSMQTRVGDQGPLSDDSGANELPHRNLGQLGKSKEGPVLGQYQPNMSFIEEE